MDNIKTDSRTVKKYLITSIIIILVAGAMIISLRVYLSKKRASSYVSAEPMPPAGQVNHVFIIMGENQSYSNVIGNTKDMPYLNMLAKTYAYATNYYADIHPSLGNYFMLTSGGHVRVNNTFSDTISDDNIARDLTAAGKTWKEYSENLPSVGYTGDDVNGYTRHHNPMSYYSDTRNNQAEAKNLVPLTQFKTDLTNHTLPNYSFIVPNNKDDAHDCPTNNDCQDSDKLKAFDNWLKKNIDPVIHSPDFDRPGGGVLIITFDEANPLDGTNGGGHTVWVIVGHDVKKGYTSDAPYRHENTCRFTYDLLGLTDFPGEAAKAASMKEFMIGN